MNKIGIDINLNKPAIPIKRTAKTVSSKSSELFLAGRSFFELNYNKYNTKVSDILQESSYFPKDIALIVRDYFSSSFDLIKESYCFYYELTYKDFPEKEILTQELSTIFEAIKPKELIDHVNNPIIFYNNSFGNSYEIEERFFFIHLAVAIEDSNFLKKLLILAADIEAKDWYGNTALVIAVRLGNINAVNMLIHHKVNVNVNHIASHIFRFRKHDYPMWLFNCNQYTILLHAIHQQYYEIVEALLNANAVIKKSDLKDAIKEMSIRAKNKDTIVSEFSCANKTLEVLLKYQKI